MCSSKQGKMIIAAMEEEFRNIRRNRRKMARQSTKGRRNSKSISWAEAQAITEPIQVPFLIPLYHLK